MFYAREFFGKKLRPYSNPGLVKGAGLGQQHGKEDDRELRREGKPDDSLLDAVLLHFVGGEEGDGGEGDESNEGGGGGESNSGESNNAHGDNSGSIGGDNDNGDNAGNADYGGGRDGRGLLLVTGKM